MQQDPQTADAATGDTTSAKPAGGDPAGIARRFRRARLTGRGRGTWDGHFQLADRQSIRTRGRARASRPRRCASARWGLNRDTAPFVIRDGRPEGVDLVVEWKIVDAQWYEIFAKAGVQRLFKVLMRFDEARGVVRSADQEWVVEWRAGVPDLTLAASGFRGQKWEISFETVYAFLEDGSSGEIYDYEFNTAEIKGPLRQAAAEGGRVWKGVAFGTLQARRPARPPPGRRPRRSDGPPRLRGRR